MLLMNIGRGIRALHAMAPIAVSVVSGYDLTNRGVTEISQLTQLVPALRAKTGAAP